MVMIENFAYSIFAWNATCVQRCFWEMSETSLISWVQFHMFEYSKSNGKDFHYFLVAPMSD